MDDTQPVDVDPIGFAGDPVSVIVVGASLTVCACTEGARRTRVVGTQGEVVGEPLLRVRDFRGMAFEAEASRLGGEVRRLD